MKLMNMMGIKLDNVSREDFIAWMVSNNSLSLVTEVVYPSEVMMTDQPEHKGKVWVKKELTTEKSS